MASRKPRVAHCTTSAFVHAGVFLLPQRGPAKLSQCRRQTLVCRATKLLVLDLPPLLAQSSPDELSSFSERVTVDRKRAKDTTYVLYTTPEAHITAKKAINESGLVEPDAIAALDGAELYQRGYRTADPFWEKTVGKEWDSKPALWVMEKFFGEELESEGEEMVFVKKREGRLGEEVEKKLSEMGVKARVREEEDRVVLMPSTGGGVGPVVGFCQRMLGVPADETYVWGEEVEGCVKLMGEGVKGVLDGVLEHAVF